MGALGFCTELAAAVSVALLGEEILQNDPSQAVIEE
jgi:hypothetical protein